MTVIKESTQVNRIIYGLISQGSLDKAEEIHSFSKGRKRSLGELTNTEKQELIKFLRKRVKDKLHPMRAKIVHRLCLLGYTKGTSPDYDKINAHIKEIGSNNPRKVPLMGLSYLELVSITTQVEARYRRSIKK